MPRLEIDNRTVEAPKGTKVITAAEKLGIYIPRFCYHEALGSVGACRMCAVMFLEGPVTGLNMSCMVEVKDGMVVSTDHPEVMRFRSRIIEWLMANHPHDCPVCDEGGHCLLQDLTVSGGHGVRRYDGPKRTYHNQYLGPLTAHEMNRCIHCWRCRRFYQEYSGYRDLGAMQIGWRTYFGRQGEGRLESPFSGNLIDICPTGVYTDRPSRYKGRRWDFQRSNSICPHCSLGCAVTVNARYRQVVRLEARKQTEVNGHFICDRGRYGYGFANLPERPRLARVDGKEAEASAAIEAAAERLSQVTEKYGAGSAAALGSTRMSLEAQVALANLSRERGWSGPRFFLEPDLAMRVHGAVRGLEPELALSQTELFRADFILALGVDPLAEAPMLALAMRQAVRGGAETAVLDPRPLELPFETRRLTLDCGLLEVGAAWLVRQAFGAKTRIKLDQAHPDLLQPAKDPPLDKKQLRELKIMSRALARSKRPALICGTDMVPQGLPARIAGFACLLREHKKEAGIIYTLPGCNAFGAVMTAPEEPSAGNMLEAMESGEVRALLAVENDPLFGFHDRARLQKALKRLDLLVVLDHLPSRTADLAQVMIPTSNLFEAAGASLVNHEGRLQKAHAVQAVGAPISQVGDGGRPTRVFSPEAPGGQPRPAELVLGEMGRRLAPESGQWSAPSPLERLAEALGRESLVYGERLLPVEAGQAAEAEQTHAAPPGADRLELMVSPWFGSGEELSFHSPIPAAPEQAAAVWLHPDTAAALGLDPERGVRLELEQGDLRLALRTSDQMSAKTALLTPGPEDGWQVLPGRRSLITASALRPEKEA